MKTLHCARRCGATAVAVFLFVLTAAGTARGGLITNGSFESGLSGWTVVDQFGSAGTFFLQSGTFSPVTGFSVPAPPEGLNAAMSDAEGPGSHVLYQDFLVPSSPTQGNLSFSLYIGNHDAGFFSPATLDFSTPVLNQQFRADILFSGSDPFTVAPADVLLNLYQTNPGDPAVSGYNTITTDVSGLLAAHTGQTLRLRFAEVDNLFIFNIGVDDVQLSGASPVPEPSSLAVFGITSLLGMINLRRRRRSETRDHAVPELSVGHDQGARSFVGLRQR